MKPISAFVIRIEICILIVIVLKLHRRFECIEIYLDLAIERLRKFKRRTVKKNGRSPFSCHFPSINLGDMKELKARLNVTPSTE